MPLVFHCFQSSASPWAQSTSNFHNSYAAPALSHSLRISFPTRLNLLQCRVSQSGSAYSFLNFVSNFNDGQCTKMASIFPGCDYEHGLIVMDNPGGEGAMKQQMIDCYIQTLAKVVGRFA